MIHIWQKKTNLVLFPEIGQVEIFLSVTRRHSRMCIRIYIFDFKKQTNKQKTKNTKNVQETKEEKRISPETSISENKSFCLFVCYFFQG